MEVLYVVGAVVTIAVGLVTIFYKLASWRRSDKEKDDVKEKEQKSKDEAQAVWQERVGNKIESLGEKADETNTHLREIKTDVSDNTKRIIALESKTDFLEKQITTLNSQAGKHDGNIQTILAKFPT